VLDACDDLAEAWREGMEFFSEDGPEAEVNAAHKRIEDVRSRASKFLHSFREADEQRQLF
jgi:hypothetical protein